jgi:OOP family OmpA-OmpF porin
MATSLLESLTRHATQQLVPAATAKLGESEPAVTRALHASYASILAGLVSRVGEPGVMRKVFDLVSSPSNDARLLEAGSTLRPDTLTNLLDLSGSSSVVGQLGSKFTSVLFDGNSAEAAEVVARHSGLRFESAAKLLTLCGPLVLSVLGRSVRDNRLDLAGFANMMMTQKDEILRAAPPGITALLDRFGGTSRETVRPVSTYAEPPRTVVAEPRASSMRWLLPALGALAALFVVWSATRRASVDRAATRADSAVTRMSEAAGDVARSTGAAVSSAVASLGDFVRRRLPNGTELNVPERGIESHLITFIEDGNRPVSDTLWFNFDRLLFDTDAATLQPQSQEQLRNIAEVLKAYPNVAMKVGGYTDNTGDPAANLDLSQRRATNVRQALVDLGVPANRLQAEGYGERHPVADNMTEEGRQQNRRIALNITRK